MNYLTPERPARERLSTLPHSAVAGLESSVRRGTRVSRCFLSAHELGCKAQRTQQELEDIQGCLGGGQPCPQALAAKCV